MKKISKAARESIAEMERLAAGSSNTFEETEAEIRRVERKRMKKRMELPGVDGITRFKRQAPK